MATTWAVYDSVAPLGGVVAGLLVIAPVFEPLTLAVAWFKHNILARYGTVGIPAVQSHQISAPISQNTFQSRLVKQR